MHEYVSHILTGTFLFASKYNFEFLCFTILKKTIFHFFKSLLALYKHEIKQLPIRPFQEWAKFCSMLCLYLFMCACSAGTLCAKLFPQEL